MQTPQPSKPIHTRHRGLVLAVLVLLIAAVPLGLAVRLIHAWTPAHHHDAPVIALQHAHHDDAVLEQLPHAHSATARHHHAPRTAGVHVEADANPTLDVVPERRLFNLPHATRAHLFRRARGDHPHGPMTAWFASRAADAMERPPRGRARHPRDHAG